MEAKQWSHMDKSTWGPGPWQSEPDKMQWADPATGLPCLIVRNHGGALCGYVGVAEGHPWFGVGYGKCLRAGCTEDWCGHYEDRPEGRVGVHGGLTFADFCQPHGPGQEGRGICHVPGAGEPDRVWWFGFDCAHSGDQSPATDAIFRNQGRSDLLHAYGYESYRDVDYVKRGVTRLAAQLAAVVAP